MERVKIIRIPVFLANSYLLVGEKNAIIVDTGDPGHSHDILKAMAANDVTPAMVSLIHITHGHVDHYGSVYELKKMVDAPVAIHSDDLPYLLQGIQAPLYPTNNLARCLKAVGGNFKVRRRYNLQSEIILNEPMDLNTFGIAGKIIATPGHTLGSSSLILEDGRAFTGDLLVHERFLRGRPVRPPFMHDLHKHRESIQKLIKEGVTSIYPGHGTPFGMDQVRCNSFKQANH